MNNILKIYSRRQCCYRMRRGWWDCTARAESDIYDCFVTVMLRYWQV